MKKAIYILAFAAIFASCDKNEDVPSGGTANLLTASRTIDFVNDIDFQTAVEIGNLLAGRNAEPTPSCATVTTSGTDYPRTFILDFGAGCTHNNITRSGILTITLSAPTIEPGAQITMQRDNYYINGHHVEGTVVYINDSTTTVPQWTRNISTGQVTTPEGIVYTHSGTHTVQLTAGADTTAPEDNVYLAISGEHTVGDNAGETLTATIVEPLVKAYTCNYISAGVLALEGTTYNGELNYGDGDCDATGTYTNSEGVTSTIQL